MFPARILTFAALLGACALVGVLSYQNRMLAAENRRILEERMQPAIGEWLPSFATRDLDGHPVEIAAASSKQLLYFFSPSCPVCKQAAPRMKRLQGMLDANGNRGSALIGLGSGTGRSLRQHAKENGFGFPVVELSQKQAHLLGVKIVPTLTLVDENGKILYSHIGPVADKDMDDVVSLVAGGQRKPGANRL